MTSEECFAKFKRIKPLVDCGARLFKAGVDISQGIPSPPERLAERREIKRVMGEA